MFAYSILIYKLLHLFAVSASTSHKQLCFSIVFLYKFGKCLIQNIVSFEWNKNGKTANCERSAFKGLTFFINKDIGIDGVRHYLPIKVAAK